MEIRDGRATVTGTHAVRGVRNSTAASPSECGTHDPAEVSRDPDRRRSRFASQAESDAPVRRLLLVRHAATAATRAARFPADEPLDERGRAEAARLAAALPARREVLSSPALRCRQTADAAGLEPLAVEPALRECDFGAWAGRSLADVHAAEPDAARAWMLRADACPHGGESLAAFAGRVGEWLDREAEREGCAVAITHGGVVKAAVVRALAAPLESFWRIDAAPLAITELHAHDGRWTVTRVNWTPGGRAADGRARDAGEAGAGRDRAADGPAGAHDSAGSAVGGGAA